LPLGEIVHFDRPLAPAVLRRDGLRSALVMHAATPNGDLGAGEAAVREALHDLPLPQGAQIEIGGQAESSAAARRELLLVAGVAAGTPFEDALVAAARRRLRPVLMTTAATLAGLAPLAIGIGAGAELQRPLAIAVTGGLVLATGVTLVVMPGLTALVSRRAA